MEKLNRYISFELLFALLLIIAFFLPWLDWKMVKVVGWDIPDLQKKLTQVTNFFKFFSKNKEWVYSTHVVYVIPVLSIFVMSLWLMLKKKAARFFLFISAIFALIVSFQLFTKLPKAGSGVYLLCGTSILALIYLFFVFFKKKKPATEPIDTPPEIDGEEII